jgi:hypothetical protein
LEAEMKYMTIIAAALMFSTSALAWTPDGSAQMKPASMDSSVKTEWTGTKALAAYDWSGPAASMGDAKLAMSSDADMSGTAKAMDKMQTVGLKTDMAWTGTETGTDKKAGTDMAWNGAKAGSDTGWSETAMAGTASGKGKMDSGMSGGDMATNDMAAWTGKGAHAGMGGPLEEIQAYPACRPGPGDDRCIQLYETGGRKILTAARAGTKPNLAMGGPFEPASAGAKTQTGDSEDHAAMDHSAMGHGTGATPPAGAKSGTQDTQPDGWVEDDPNSTKPATGTSPMKG